MSSNVVLFPDSKSHLLSECAVNVVISVVVVEALVGRGIHDLVVGVSQCGGWGTTVIGPELENTGELYKELFSRGMTAHLKNTGDSPGGF